MRARFGIDILVWLGLLAFLTLTFGLAYMPMGDGNIVASTIISILKMLLVAVFYMHLRRASGLYRLAAAAGFMFFAAMVGLSLADFLTR